MIESREEVIFTAGAGQVGAELGISQSATECGQTTDKPEHYQHKKRLDAQKLKTEAGEYAGANHIGNHHRDTCSS